MAYFATNTYTLKREILTFSNKISRNLSKPERKFTADMTYGMLASGSCLLTDIVDQLHEKSRKVNSVERLTRHLNKGTPAKALNSYLSVIHKWIPATQLRNQRKGKIKVPLMYKGKRHDAVSVLSHGKVQIRHHEKTFILFAFMGSRNIP